MSIAMKTRNLTDAELEKVAQQFRLLGEPMRLKILQAICRKPLTVNEIVEATGATQSNVSKHLSLLASAGVITRQKDAQFVYYSLSDPMTLKLCELVHGQGSERSGSR
jgi:ArsR family transcriptional regulator